jgi:hypothetical protein
MAPNVSSKKVLKPKFHKIESMLSSATMLLQDYDPSDFSSKYGQKNTETERYNFTNYDPF